VISEVDEETFKGTGGAKSVERPSWRQSELDAANDFPDYSAQKSLKRCLMVRFKKSHMVLKAVHDQIIINRVIV